MNTQRNLKSQIYEVQIDQTDSFSRLEEILSEHYDIERHTYKTGIIHLDLREKQPLKD